MFATVAFEEGDVIEHCPMLLADGDQGAALEIGAEGYVFRWGDTATGLPLGYGALYNHSYDPNATTLETEDELVITATRAIAPGDEIFINYLGTEQHGVWFDVLTD